MGSQGSVRRSTGRRASRPARASRAPTPLNPTPQSEVGAGAGRGARDRRAGRRARTVAPGGVSTVALAAVAEAAAWPGALGVGGRGVAVDVRFTRGTRTAGERPPAAFGAAARVGSA